MEPKGRGGCLMVIMFGIVSAIATLIIGFNFYHEVKQKFFHIVFTLVLHWRFTQSFSTIFNCQEELSEHKYEMKWYNTVSYSLMIFFSFIYILGALSIILTLFNKVYFFMDIKILEVGYILWMYGMFCLSFNLWTCLSNIGYEGDMWSKQRKTIFEYLFFDGIIVVMLYLLGWGLKFIFMPILANAGVLIAVIMCIILKKITLENSTSQHIKTFLVFMSIVILGIMVSIPYVYYNAIVASTEVG